MHFEMIYVILTKYIYVKSILILTLIWFYTYLLIPPLPYSHYPNESRTDYITVFLRQTLISKCSNFIYIKSNIFNGESYFCYFTCYFRR